MRTAGLLLMNTGEEERPETRGEAVKRRRRAQGMSQHQVARYAKEQNWKLSRDAIMSAERDEASDETYELYNALMDRVRDLKVDPDDVEDDEGDIEVTVEGGMVEIHAKIGGDLDIVAKAPVANTAELTESVAALIREHREARRPRD